MGHILRVASYNLRDLKDDVAAAARVVQAIDPDLLCLQEVPRHLFSSRSVASFAAQCGLSWSGGHRGSGGTTVMSSPRLQVADLRHRRLKVSVLQRQRGYAVGEVRLPGHRSFWVVSLHLSLDAAERASHVATILRELPGEGSLVVAGDLNEGSDGAAWKALAGRLSLVSVDALTFPARNPRHRLDVIFTSPTLSTVSDSQVELSHADLVKASDHLPVWVDLNLSPLALPSERKP